MKFDLRLTIPAVVAVLVFGSWALLPADATGQTRSENQSTVKSEADKEEEEQWVPPTPQELRKRLSRIQFDVTQNEATEPAFRNPYWDNKREGVYKCIVCDRELFTSNTKYKSGTGWPSFYAPKSKNSVGFKIDRHLFYARTEVHCQRCKAHLGHVFDDGPKPSGKRYCMNSASLKFVPRESDDKRKKKRSE